MHLEADGRRRAPHRGRRRTVTAVLAAAVAVAAAGCTHVKEPPKAGPAKPESAVESVVTTCYQNLFYNGLLPSGAAKTNCMYCVADELEKMGVEPTPGQSQASMIAGAILTKSNLSLLQSACNQSTVAN